MKPKKGKVWGSEAKKYKIVGMHFGVYQKGISRRNRYGSGVEKTYKGGLEKSSLIKNDPENVN